MTRGHAALGVLVIGGAMIEMVKRFNAECMTPLGTTPRELDEHVARELEKWVKVTQAAGLSVR